MKSVFVYTEINQNLLIVYWKMSPKVVILSHFAVLLIHFINLICLHTILRIKALREV